MEEAERDMEQEENTRQHQLHRALQSPETASIRRRSDRVRRQQRRASTPAATTGGVSIYVGPMTTVCQHCNALRFPHETLNCCHRGKVSLPALVDYPQPLKDLFTGTSNEARNFRENIRQYNSAYSFTSFGAQTVQVSLLYIRSYIHIQPTINVHLHPFPHLIFIPASRFQEEAPTASKFMARHTT